MTASKSCGQFVLSAGDGSVRGGGCGIRAGVARQFYLAVKTIAYTTHCARVDCVKIATLPHVKQQWRPALPHLLVRPFHFLPLYILLAVQTLPAVLLLLLLPVTFLTFD